MKSAGIRLNITRRVALVGIIPLLALLYYSVGTVRTQLAEVRSPI